MWKVRTSYKSLADYDLEKMLQQKRNLVQVQSVLSVYEKNNQNLVDHVHDLIRQNQLLRTQAQNISPKKSKLSPSFNLKNSIYDLNPSLEINKSTTKKQNLSYSNSFNHPRNVYLTPTEVQLLNKKIYKQAKTAHKKYDRSKEYEQFKEKLSEKKKELRSSHRSKSNFEASRLQMSRNVYLEQQSVQNRQRHPLNQLKTYNTNTYSKNQSKLKQKSQISPYQNIQKSTLYNQKSSPYHQKSVPYHQIAFPYRQKQAHYHSPQKYSKGLNQNQKRKDTQRSSSAIKIEDVYLQNSIRIVEPRTKWGDLSSDYFDKSKWSKYDQINKMSSSQNLKEKNETESKNGKSKKKKFLNVISLSTTQEKSKQRQQQ